MKPWMALILMGLIALLVLAIVLFYLRWRKENGLDEEVRAYLDSDEPCGARNPRTGWICERWANHPKNHWQTINGERYDWPDSAEERKT